MAIPPLGIPMVFSADDKASGTILNIAGAVTNLAVTGQGLSSTMTGLGKSVTLGSQSLKAFGVALSSVLGGVLLLKGVFNLGEEAADYEAEMAKVKAITQATDDTFKQLDQTINREAIQSIFSPKEGAESLRVMAQAGLSASEAMDTLGNSLDFAAASFGGLTPETASEAFVGVMKTFNMEADQTQQIADKLTAAVTSSRLSFSELPNAIGLAARGAVVMQADLTDTIASLGLARNVLNTVERAATGVGVAMERMVRPEVRAKVEALIGTAITANGEFRPFLEILGDMAISLENLSGAARGAALQDIFGGRAASAIVPILGQLIDKHQKLAKSGVESAEAMSQVIDKLRDNIENSEGLARQFQLEYLKTFRGLSQFIEGTFSAIVIQVGQSVLDILAPALLFLKENILDPMLIALQATEKIFKDTAIAMLIAAGAAMIAVPSWMVLNAVLGHFDLTLKSILLKLSILSFKILAIAAVLVPLVAGIATAIRRLVTMNNVGQSVTETFGDMLTVVKAVGALISSGKLEGELAVEVRDRGLKDEVEGWSVLFASLGELWQEFVDGIVFGVEVVKPLFNFFGEAVAFLFEMFGNLIGSDTLTFFGALKTIMLGLGAVIGLIIVVIGSLLAILTSGIMVVVNFIIWVVKTIIDIISWVVSKLPESWVSKLAKIESGGGPEIEVMQPKFTNQELKFKNNNNTSSATSESKGSEQIKIKQDTRIESVIRTNDRELGRSVSNHEREEDIRNGRKR